MPILTSAIFACPPKFLPSTCLRDPTFYGNGKLLCSRHYQDGMLRGPHRNGGRIERHGYDSRVNTRLQKMIRRHLWEQWIELAKVQGTKSPARSKPASTGIILSSVAEAERL